MKIKKIIVLTLTISLFTQTGVYGAVADGHTLYASESDALKVISEKAEEAGAGSMEDPASEERGQADSSNYQGIEWSLDENGLLKLSGSYSGSEDISIETDILKDLYGDCKTIYCDFDPGLAPAVSFGTLDHKGSDINKIIFGENFDTRNFMSMYYMFGGCNKLTDLDLKGFNTSRVEDMRAMFKSCSALTELDLSAFNTSNVKDMSSMFMDCRNLTELILAEFDTSNVSDMASMFSGCSGLKGLYIDVFNTSNVTDMGSMFSGCGSLTELDIRNFDTSKVTNMGSMFSGCGSLTELDIKNFDTSNVNDMRWIFSSCSGISEFELSNLDTSNVSDMKGMFSGCSGIKSLDLKDFDTSKAEDMSFLFDGCLSLTSLDLSNFDTSNVLDMGDMFSDCEGLTELDFSGFDTSKTRDMAEMFIRCKSLSSLNLKSFNLSSLTDYEHMFYECSSLKELITPFNNSLETITLPRYFYNEAGYPYSVLPITENESMKLTVSGEADEKSGNYYGISWSLDEDGLLTLTGSYTGESFIRLEEEILKDHYEDCKKVICDFKPQNAKGFSFGSFTDYGSNITEITFSDNFDTKNFTTMAAMFRECSGLTRLDLSSFNTSSVTDMNFMFNNCSGLTELDLSSFDTSNVTDMSTMFRGCLNLTGLDLSNFDTSKVTDMDEMFISCSALSKLRINSFNTENTSNISYMFDACISLTSLDLSSFSLERVNLYEGVFESCNSLKEIKTPYNNSLSDLALNKVFYDRNAAEYENLPLTANKSVTLYDSKDIPISSKTLSLDTEEKTIAPKGSFIISAKVRDAEGNEIEASDLSFTSNAPEVASVDSEGEVTGVSDGKAIITVRYEDLTEICVVTVDSDFEKVGVWVKGIEDSYSYNGSAIKPLPEVYYNLEKLTEKKDYTLKYSNNIKPGKAAIVINLKGRFSGRKQLDFTIEKLDLSDITKDDIYLPYIKNKLQKPVPKLYVNDKLIKYSKKDLEISYPSIKEGAYVKAGTYPIHIAASENSKLYSGEKDINLIITDKELMSKIKVEMIGEKPSYTGEPIEPLLKLTDSRKKVLLENEDYKLSYEDSHTDPGKHKIILEGMGTDYVGFKTYTFTIGGKYDLADEEYTEIEIDSDALYMDGKVYYSEGGAVPGFKVTYKGEELTPARDYQLQYLDNKALGTAKAVIKGKGKYTGSRVESFDIVRRDISTLRLNISDVKYSNKANAYKNNKYIFTDDDYKDQKLKLNRDYTLEYEKDYKSPDVGTEIKVTIAGKGNYTGSMTASYRVIDPAKDISKAKVVINKGKAYEYTGSQIEPSYSEISLLLGKNNTLTDNDYEIAGYYNNVNTGGKALVLLRGINGYTGSRLVKFKIDPEVIR